MDLEGLVVVVDEIIMIIVKRNIDVRIMGGL